MGSDPGQASTCPVRRRPLCCPEMAEVEAQCLTLWPAYLQQTSVLKLCLQAPTCSLHLASASQALVHSADLDNLPCKTVSQ